MKTSLNNEIGYEHGSFTCVKIGKNETRCHEHGSFPMPSSLKNETNPLPIRVFD